MPQPRMLARGSLLLSLLIALLAAPGVFASTLAAAPATQQSEAASGIVSLTAATGATPEYAGGGKLAALQPALLQQAAGEVVISEVRFRGDNGGGDEFIELFNPTCTSSFPLNGLKIRWSDGIGGTSPLYQFPASPPDITLAPGQYYLLAPAGPNYDDGVPADATYAGGVPDDGGVALMLSDESLIIDQVGLSEDTIYKEGTPLPTLGDDDDMGYRRISSALEIHQDTEDNSLDFGAPVASDPQNSATTVPCGTPTPIPTSTPTNTATATPTSICPGLQPAPGQILINEVAWSGTQDGSQDYWIELFNTHPLCTVQLDGWRLVGVRSGSVNLASEVNFDSDDEIPPLHYMVITRVDGTFNPVLDPDVEMKVASGLTLGSVGQSLQLFSPGDALLVDHANYSLTGTLPWPAGSTSQRRSMERHHPTADTPTNWATFARPLPFPSEWPRARGGGDHYIFGTPGMANWSAPFTLTPSPIPTKARTPTPRPPTPFPHMVINEFLPRAGTDWNGDGTVNVLDEFIEVKNLGPIDADLAGWRLDDAANLGSPAFTLPSVKLKPGERAVFYGLTTGILLEDSGDTVRLINAQGAVIDGRTYGVTETIDVSHCRIPDGYYWRTACFSTPGLENALTGVAPAPAPIVLGAPPPCLLPDTAPQPFIQAECQAYGADIWDRTFWDEPRPRVIVVKDGHTKWKTSIE